MEARFLARIGMGDRRSPDPALEHGHGKVRRRQSNFMEASRTPIVWLQETWDLSWWNEHGSESMESVERQKKPPHFDELERWFAERGGKLVDGSDKMNALGIVGGVAPRQGSRLAKAEHETEQRAIN
jgi:hypothetical protein